MKNKEIIVGTSKGFVVFEKKENVWGVKKIHFLGLPVSTIYKNEFTGTWWTGISHRHWGQKLYFSDNLLISNKASANFPLGITPSIQ